MFPVSSLLRNSPTPPAESHTNKIKNTPQLEKQKRSGAGKLDRPHGEPSISRQTARSPPSLPPGAQHLIRSTRRGCWRGGWGEQSPLSLPGARQLLPCVLQFERPQSEVIPQGAEPRHQPRCCSNDWIICLGPAPKSSAPRRCLHWRLGMSRRLEKPAEKRHWGRYWNTRNGQEGHRKRGNVWVICTSVPCCASHVVRVQCESRVRLKA